MNTFNHQTGQYLTTAGANIYYEIAGEPNGPVMLLLHGGFGTLEDWNALTSDLPGHFKLIAIDSRGHGKSTLGNETLSYGLIQQDVEAVLDHLGVTEVSILGFSDGGIVAYRLASLSKIKVTKLITMDSRWHYKDALEKKEILGRVTADGWKTKFPQTYEAYQKLNPARNFGKLVPEVVAMWLDAGPNGYPGDDVGKMDCPLLTIRGDEDHLISRRCVFELAERIKGARLLNVPFAGHAVYIDQKETVIQCIKQFLTEK